MKNKFGRVLQILVALMLVSAVFVSSMLGTVNADYFKSLSQKLKFEATPDIAWKWYLKDDSKTSSGKINSLDKISVPFEITQSTGYDSVYHIAIPVDEEGVYNLTFTADFAEVVDGEETATEFFPVNLNAPIGCEVISSDTTYYYESTTPYRLAAETRIALDTAESLSAENAKPYSYLSKKSFETNGAWKWKTVAPSRAERVTLTYLVTDDDVTAGYVLWIWDFHGLATGTYNLNLTEVSSSKMIEPESNEPYIDFTNMTYKNMSIMPNVNSSSNVTSGTAYTDPMVPTRHVDQGMQGHNVAGITRDSGGRGTYVTQAGYDGMTMQVEPLYFAYDHDKDWGITGSDEPDNSGKYDYSNPVTLNIPVKNIKRNTSYKVTFDFSIASQGTEYIAVTGRDITTDIAGAQIYADYESKLSDFFIPDEPMKLDFQSYLYKEEVLGFGLDKMHLNPAVRGYYRMANKRYQTHWLTRYTEIAQAYSGIMTKDAAVKSNVTSSVNSYYTDDTSHMNWLNAVEHKEYNGQNAITWLTFSNTSFTFNIDGYYDKAADIASDGKENTDAKSWLTYGNNDVIDTLYWVWCIDALQPSTWFRIKIDNVRIEEIVQYGANIGSSENKGIKIGSEEVDVNAIFNNEANPYRGSSGSGQNFADRHYSSSLYSAALHIYAPIYDASDLKIDLDDKYKVYLSGYCTVKGGIDRYVWSTDNGKTWHDMCEVPTNPPGKADEDIIQQSEFRVDSCVVNKQSPTVIKAVVDADGNVIKDALNHVDFNVDDDGAKADFTEYNIYADLSNYKYQKDIDIIFAAVPKSNINLRCEILRIENFNSSVDYRTYTLEYESDIGVTTNDGTQNIVSPLNAVYKIETAKLGGGESTKKFTDMYGVKTGGTLAQVGGYANRTSQSSAYKDVRTLFIGMPVKTTLTVRGWAIVESGIEQFMWTPDYGKTWYPIGKMQIVDGENKFVPQLGIGSGRVSDVPGQYEDWIEAATIPSALSSNAYFDKVGDVDYGLKIDLSAYAGQTIDVIVAAKPKTCDALCPVSRIDNVAVYGDASTDAPNDRGTFYTRVESIKINDTAVPSVTTDVFGATMSHANWSAALNLEGTAITSLEPYHTNIISTRMYNNVVNQIPNGGKVTVEGFTICKNGVNRYLYSLDGGKTWNTIDAAVCVDAESNFINAGKKVDSGFELTDTNGDGRTDIANAVYRSDKEGGKLEFNLPEQEIGSEKYLLIVAESNANTDVNGDGSLNDPSGKYYPVSQIKIKIVA